MTATDRGSQAEEFTRLVRSFDARLRALAFRLLGDADRMDDALQDAYAKAFRSFAMFRQESDPGTWLYRIVYNSCVDLLRREVRHQHDDLTLNNPAHGSSPEAKLSLADALAQLSVEHRAVVLLVDVDGFDYAEVADTLGVAVGTVASRLSRAHALLRRYLQEVE